MKSFHPVEPSLEERGTWMAMPNGTWVVMHENRIVGHVLFMNVLDPALIVVIPTTSGLPRRIWLTETDRVQRYSS